MIAVIDTSSLVSLVRYYLPFDEDAKLLNYISQRIIEKQIIILEKVYDESKYAAGGIVVNKIGFLKEKKYRTKSDDLLPDSEYFRLVEHEFCYDNMKTKLGEVKFESAKSKFLQSADSKLLLFALKNKESGDAEKIVIISEETESNNDKKAFKKIPILGKFLKLEVQTLPDLLKSFKDIKIIIQ